MTSRVAAGRALRPPRGPRLPDEAPDDYTEAAFIRFKEERT